MPKQNVLEKSKQIKQRLFSLDVFIEAQTILFYISYDNEVDTHEMIKESLRIGKQVVVPKVNMNNETIVCSLLNKWDDLAVGAYQILEPRHDCVKKVSPDSVDLMIIPGVVFDGQGNRIGHGKGYYDKLLQKKTHAHRLGLAFELQIVDSIPAEKYDIKVDHIITEKRVIRCS